ncbi:cation:proton antiporter [Caproicibacter sp.]|uniref:cation:proton antiporter n=1 Tax=Caproicibacter sp. TaxID=2814884 RepID=UPI003988E9EC
MTSYHFLFDLALILLSTKLLGLLTRKVQMPQVVGALLAGLILGPAMLNILKETDFISKTAEIGVIVLMFTAGLETDFQEMKKTGKASFLIAMVGVLIPLAGGYAVAAMFNKTMLPEVDVSLFLQNVFIGVILTATSVSITVETLNEIGALNTRSGNAILGAAVIDDVLGIVCLTLVTSAADPSVNIAVVLLKIVGFFFFAGVAGYLFYLLFKKMINRSDKDLRRYVILAFVFCLLLSYCAERFFGVADITGAYIAGLILSNTKETEYITSRFNTVSYALLSPMFFASIGINVSLPEMTPSILWFSVLLTVVAVLTKIVGCGLGARLCRFTGRESLQIGVGMISRGEVALIVANKGFALKMMSPVYLGPVVLTVILTTILTPILLKIVYRNQDLTHNSPEMFENKVGKHYQAQENYDKG